MIAFARLASVPCQRLAPDADSFRALALRRLVQPPITEEEIAAKEKDIKRLRVRLGLSSWCKRYAGQMEQPLFDCSSPASMLGKRQLQVHVQA
jgi:hypothetical protein